MSIHGWLNIGKVVNVVGYYLKRGFYTANGIAIGNKNVEKRLKFLLTSALWVNKSLF